MDTTIETRSLAEVVKARCEQRPVTVEWRKDSKTSTMKLVRLDTDTVIDTRAMTAAEKQVTLNLNPAPKANAEAKATAKKNGKVKKEQAPAPATTA